MKLNIIRKEALAARPYPDELYNFPITIIPAMQYGIWLKSQKYYWLTDEDASRARSALAEAGAALLMPIGWTLHNDLQAMYNLLDWSLRGHHRTFTGTGTQSDPYVFDDAIPPVPNSYDPYDFDPSHQSLMNWSQTTVQNLNVFDTYFEAALLGDPDQGIDVSHTTYGQLERIEAAIEAQADNTAQLDEIITDLELLAALLGV